MDLLKNGKTRGFWLLLLAAPFRGRAIPLALFSFSSKTLNDTATSRNPLHLHALLSFQDLIGNRPVMMDQGFCSTPWLRHLKEGGMSFVVRQKMRPHPPVFLDGETRRVRLGCPPGGRVVFRGLRYRGEVEVNGDGWVAEGSWRAFGDHDHLGSRGRVRPVPETNRVIAE